MFKSIFALLTFSLLIFTASLNAQDEMSADQKAWMDYMTPGPMHEMMAGSVGEWISKNTLPDIFLLEILNFGILYK